MQILSVRGFGLRLREPLQECFKTVGIQITKLPKEFAFNDIQTNETTQTTPDMRRSNAFVNLTDTIKRYNGMSKIC